MRTSTLSLTIGLAVSGLFACGDDGNPAIDAPPPIVDAPPDGTPPDPFKGFDADEGGEVRVEYVRTAAGNSGARVTAFFYDDPGTTRFFPFLNVNGCTDMRPKTMWPMAQNANRTYLDAGGVTILGGPNPLPVPSSTAAADPFARTHDDNEWYFNGFAGTDTDGPDFLVEKQLYDVAIGGSADMPGQLFDDVLYMPADFALTSPDATPYALTAGQDHTFEWTTPTDSPPAEFEVQSLVGFTGPNGPVVVCIEPNDGALTVPAAMIDIVRAEYPGGGTMARQTLTHVVRELVDSNGPTGRRIDFVSVWCYATGFTVPAT